MIRKVKIFSCACVYESKASRFAPFSDKCVAVVQQIMAGYMYVSFLFVYTCRFRMLLLFYVRKHSCCVSTSCYCSSKPRLLVHCVLINLCPGKSFNLQTKKQNKTKQTEPKQKKIKMVQTEHSDNCCTRYLHSQMIRVVSMKKTKKLALNGVEVRIMPQK